MAAHALGNLGLLLPGQLRAVTLSIANDHGVWACLLGALASTLGDDSPELEDACIVALAQLLCPGTAGTAAPGLLNPVEARAAAAKERDVARRLMSALVRDVPLLTRLAACLQRGSSSRATLAVARLLAHAAERGALHATSDAQLAASPLPDALLAVAGGTTSAAAEDDGGTSDEPVARSGKDAAVAALALLRCASAAPGVCSYALGAGLAPALAALYRRALSPSEQGPLGPADGARLLARCVQLPPSSAGGPKALARALLAGGAPECLASYAAVSAGALSAAVAAAAAAAQGPLAAAAEALGVAAADAVARAEVAQNRVDQLALSIEEEEGVEEPDWDHLDRLDFQLGQASADLDATDAEARALQGADSGAEAAGKSLADVASRSGTKAPTKVKAAPPNLPVLGETLDALAALSVPPPSSNKDPDAAQVALTAQAHARMLAGGILPACLRLGTSLDNAGDLASSVARLLLVSLQVPDAVRATLMRHRSSLVALVAAIDSAESAVRLRMQTGGWLLVVGG
ncbi:hypothetical protein FOA52_013761 [Chlamydomonas sp. UWO 241]|nr:hypothetical protein FOA52_013761 [Chlamydomonas sp. UWO 241]